MKGRNCTINSLAERLRDIQTSQNAISEMQSSRELEAEEEDENEIAYNIYPWQTMASEKVRSLQVTNNQSRSSSSNNSDYYNSPASPERTQILLNMIKPPVDFSPAVPQFYPQPSMLIGAFPPLFDISGVTGGGGTQNRETQQYLAHVLSKSSKKHRGEKKPIPDLMKDSKYFERRKRNNVAAKKSRDARKTREDQIANRADLLEKENAQLRLQIANLRELSTSLRAVLLTRAASSLRQ